MALFPPLLDAQLIPGTLWTTGLTSQFLERDYSPMEGPLEFAIERKVSPTIDQGNNWQAAKSVQGIWIEFPIEWRKDATFRDWIYTVWLTVELQEDQSVGLGNWNARLAPESGNWGDSVNSYIEWGDAVTGDPLPGINDPWGNGSTGAWQIATVGCSIVGVPYGPCQYRIEFVQRDLLESAALAAQRPIDLSGYGDSYLQFSR